MTLQGPNPALRMQAVLITTSLLLVAAMLGSLLWLSTQRVPAENEE